MKVELISHTNNAAYLCGEAAAVCTNSDKPERAFCHAVDSGHTSILEHAVFTFKIEGLSRAALAQLTRHRLASFDVQSQRYVRIPEVNSVNSDNSNSGNKGNNGNNGNSSNNVLIFPESIKESSFYNEAKGIMGYVMTLYQRMVDAGIPCEDARYITPQAVPTTLIMTMNARELLHFFSLRTCNRAQWEIRELADQMLKIVKQTEPRIFYLAGPACVTTGTCPEKKPCGYPRNQEDWN